MEEAIVCASACAREGRLAIIHERASQEHQTFEAHGKVDVMLIQTTILRREDWFSKIFDISKETKVATCQSAVVSCIEVRTYFDKCYCNATGIFNMAPAS